MKEQGHDVCVCYRGIREPKIDNSDYIPVAGMIEPVVGRLAAWITGYEGYTHPIATRKLIRITKQFNPDIVQVNILHGYYINGNQYLEFLKDNNFRVCYSMFDEYAYMGKCAFSFRCNQFITGCRGNCPEKRRYPKSWFFDRSEFIFNAKKKIYNGFKHIVFVGTGWVVDRAKESALLKEKHIEVVDEPINYEEVFYPRDTTDLRHQLQIPDDKIIILTVAPLNDSRKGGGYFYKVAEKLIDNNNLVFVYVGCNAPEPKRLSNLIAIPFVHSQDQLAEYYSLADLFVCTSLADTTACTCLEALGCGTPIAGFAEAGTPYVAPIEYLSLVKTFDIDGLSKIVSTTTKKSKEHSKACVNYARSKYSRTIIFNKLESIYKDLYNES
jgi:glycosyltransferase involved in cell wall biosynthesis